MLKARAQSDFGPQRQEPNLFVAAQDDDVAHLEWGFAAGKRLDEQDHFHGLTPLHIAALNGSAAFIGSALGHESANVWIRDFEGRLPIDHSDARLEYAISKLFYEVMYPQGEVPMTVSEG